MRGLSAQALAEAHNNEDEYQTKYHRYWYYENPDRFFASWRPQARRVQRPCIEKRACPLNISLRSTEVSGQTKDSEVLLLP